MSVEDRQYCEEEIVDGGGSDRCLLAAVYWWQTVLAVLLGMVQLVFGMILYNLLRVVILAALLLFVVRYGGYWLWRKLTGREA